MAYFWLGCPWPGLTPIVGHHRTVGVPATLAQLPPQNAASRTLVAAIRMALRLSRAGLPLPADCACSKCKTSPTLLLMLTMLKP